ncbi:hypothetical protein B4098_2686 [Heyndrickxia coagulans]|uniref:Uncharacterized protein n=1 Tax=Heyndrickxia coagulans TaxID=1398 RepID=A0A150JRM7_HEYCO|nr:hypothetical protein B4098_2686 [Heyndrickxia coagulans]
MVFIIFQLFFIIAGNARNFKRKVTIGMGPAVLARNISRFPQ